jgi:ketosteroid isomerase-like protein
MKKFLIIIVIAASAVSCCNKTIEKKDRSTVNVAKEKENVALVLENYVLASERQDLNLIKEIWASEPDIVVFGTSSDEKLIGWEAISDAFKRQFNASQETYIAVSDQKIDINDTGNTAWFSEIINYNYVYHGKARKYEGLRFTGVLEKRDGEWKIVQSHMSIPEEED